MENLQKRSQPLPSRPRLHARRQRRLRRRFLGLFRPLPRHIRSPSHQRSGTLQRGQTTPQGRAHLNPLLLQPLRMACAILISPTPRAAPPRSPHSANRTPIHDLIPLHSHARNLPKISAASARHPRSPSPFPLLHHLGPRPAVGPSLGVQHLARRPRTLDPQRSPIRRAIPTTSQPIP